MMNGLLPPWRRPCAWAQRPQSGAQWEPGQTQNTHTQPQCTHLYVHKCDSTPVHAGFSTPHACTQPQSGTQWEHGQTQNTHTQPQCTHIYIYTRMRQYTSSHTLFRSAGWCAHFVHTLPSSENTASQKESFSKSMWKVFTGSKQTQGHTEAAALHSGGGKGRGGVAGFVLHRTGPN